MNRVHPEKILFILCLSSHATLFPRPAPYAPTLCLSPE